MENLTLLGAAAINGSGNALANAILGNGAANSLFGNGGNDSLDGGLGADAGGDDTYVVDNTGDVTFEGGALDGLDIVFSSVARTLGANLENLTLTGAAAIVGNGNSLNNTILGNTAANTLFGNGGDDALNGAGGNDILHGGIGADALDGGIGADTAYGGAGDDSYFVDSGGDITFEVSALDGTDIVFSSVTRALGPNLENMTLTGVAAINGGGNALNNIMIGNNAINALFGNGGNDTLNGGQGADKMYGGVGDDIYVVDNASDITFEGSPLDGVDTVLSSVARTLGANLENLTLTGAAALTGAGNGLANIVSGNDAANTLFGNGGDDHLSSGGGTDIVHGNDGADTIDGGAGGNTMYGEAGDDIYVVDHAGDVTFEGSALDGTDLVFTSVTRSLGANLENLTLTGSAAINGVGNSLGNIIVGNAGANQLFGNLGDDVLAGGAGNDLLNGGAGNDRFVFAPGSGADTITGFVAGRTDDSLDLSAYAGGITWTITRVGANTVFDFSNGDQITLTNVLAANLVQTDPFGFG